MVTYRVYVNRWATFVASALIQSCAGLTYSWSIVAPALKERFGFNEQQIDIVGSTMNLGGYGAILSGALMDYLSEWHQLGPRIVLWVGVALLVTGFAGLHALAVSAAQPSLALVMLFAFIAGNAGTWFDTAALTTNLRNFPNDRGTVVGILKSFVGLSASLFASVYAAAYQPDSIGFLYFMAAAPCLVILSASIFVNYVPPEYHEAESVLIPSPSGSSPLAGVSPRTSISPRPTLSSRPARLPEEVDELSFPMRRTETASHLYHRLQCRLYKRYKQHRHRVCMSKQARFALCYVLVAALAIYQLLSTLYESQHRSSRRNLTELMILILALLLFVPLYSGGCLPTRTVENPLPSLDHSSRRRRTDGDPVACTGLQQALLHPASIEAGDGREDAAVGDSDVEVPGASALSDLPPEVPVGPPAFSFAVPNPSFVAPSHASSGALTSVTIDMRPNRQVLDLKSHAVQGGSSGSDSFRLRGADSLGLQSGGDSAPLLLNVDSAGTASPSAGSASVVQPAVYNNNSASQPSKSSPTAGTTTGLLPDQGGISSCSAEAAANAGTGRAGKPSQCDVWMEFDASSDSSRSGDREDEGDDDGGVPTGAPQDMTTWQAACSLPFWLLVLQVTIGIGTGLTFVNNLGGLLVALGGTPGGQVIFVSLFSVSNASGRLLFGYVSERYLQSHGTPRTSFLLAISACTLGVCVFASQADLADLYSLSIVAGLAFGGHWSVVPSIASDIFGLRYFASIYTTLQLAPATGSFLMASLLAGRLYDRAAQAHGDKLYCLGIDCYQTTWYVLAGLNAVALVGSQLLVVHTRSTYARMVAARKGSLDASV